MFRTAFLAAALAVSVVGCTTIVEVEPPRCSELVPKNWAEKIAGAPLPDFAFVDEISQQYPELADRIEAREWQKFGVEQSGKLEESENRRQDTMTIITNCEEKFASAVKKVEKKWWEFWK